MKSTVKKQIYRYLIEILIIVLGVLIAFYLTNWGQEVKERKTEGAIVAQIYFELSDNLVDLKNDLELHRNALKSQLKIQAFLEGENGQSDSLMMDFYWASKDEYIFPNTSAFEDLKSTGMGIIRNDSIRNLITLVYNNYFPRISKGNNLHPDITTYLHPFYKTHFKVNRDPSISYDLYLGDSLKVTYPRDFGNGIQQLIGYLPINGEDLKQNEEFRYLISEILWFRIYKINYYQLSIQNVENILEQMERVYPSAMASKTGSK